MLKEAEEVETKTGKVLVGQGRKFDRIRRITGYLVGVVDRFGDAKRAELNDRVIHVGAHAGMPPKRI